MPRRLLDARTYALFSLGVAAFTLYGSYVPFHYRSRSWGDATGAFRWAMENRLAMESRSDWVANCMLGVPLGFCVLAALRVDRPPRAAALRTGSLLLPLCFAFAAAVEFGQLYFPGRTCAGSDVWAQGLGSSFGILAWVLRGQWATDRVRGAFEAQGERGNVAVLILGYIAFMALVEFLPFDLTISPGKLYHRANDVNITTLVPLSELDYRPGRTELDDWKKVQNWLELIALSWPLGALAARLPGRWRIIDGLPHVFALALVVAALLELGQLAVESHYPSTTDVLVLTSGILIGWAAALSFADRGVRKRRMRVALALALGAVWFLVLAVIHWHPFDFRTSLLSNRLAHLDWMPMAGLAEKNYLGALNEVLSKFIIFVPIGVLWIWACNTAATRLGKLVPALIAGGVAAILEFGQALIQTRFASPTDVLFGFVGGWIGAEATRRIARAAERRELILPPHAGRAGAKRRAAVLPGASRGNDGSQ
jgi:glycopeptide antibiotics resistance protein